MKDYQQTYIANLKQAISLSDTTPDLGLDAEHFLSIRDGKRRKISVLVEENTALLRKYLFPTLDDIITTSEQDIRQLLEFADALMAGQLDVMLNYTIHNALIVYARHHNLRDMLIRELYNTGMALFYVNSLIETTDPYRYLWKMQMLFGEAAAYIKVYDDIKDPETRGYIHRSMGNLALGYTTQTAANSNKKMQILRKSLQVLNDPVYQQKTPSLPWSTYIYKSHQERTTSISFLRNGTADAQTTREVMESAEYVWKRQQESSRKTGRPLAVRWHVTYEVAQYHCGVLTLEQLLTRMEELYMQRDVSDFSDDGCYSNLFLPAIYAEYLLKNNRYKAAKKEVQGHMYRMMLRYVRSVPPEKMTFYFVRNLMNIFITFIEYPDGIQQRDFLLQLAVCRNPEAFVYLQMTACVSRMLLRQLISKKPELLIGVLDCQSIEEVRASQDRLEQFAYDCGMFHNIGQLNFSRITTMTGRGWLKEEKEMFRYHVKIGARILRRCESTRLFADAAEGHHFYYDTLGGYPEEYDPREHPNQPVVDIVGIAAYFNRLLDDTIDYTRKPLTLDETFQKIKEKSGTRFSPEMVTVFLEMKDELNQYLKDGRLQAYSLALEYLKSEDRTEAQPIREIVS